MKSDVHFSTKTDEWSTPKYVFDMLNEEFDFTLDPCAIPENAKCANFYTEQQGDTTIEGNGQSAPFPSMEIFASLLPTPKSAQPDTRNGKDYGPSLSEALTSSRGDFLVSHSATLDEEKERQMTATSGRLCLSASLFTIHDGSSLQSSWKCDRPASRSGNNRSNESCR